MTMQHQTTTTYRTALEDIEISADVESAIAQMQASGKDTGSLTAQQRAGYVTALCRALRLNPLTNPVQFIRLNGKEVLYVTRTATDQLAALHGLNRRTVRGPEIVDIAGTKIALCTVEATLPNGRSETATATLPVSDPAMLYMKCETKAKRRATLAILGLGLLAEEEAESIPGGERVPVETPRAVSQPEPRDLARLGIEMPAAVLPLAPLGAVTDARAPVTSATVPLAYTTPGLTDAEVAAMLAMIVACETLDALDATRAEIRPDVSTRATAAQRAHLRAAAEARRAALTPTEPTEPTPPRGGRKSTRSNTTAADGAPAESSPAAEAPTALAAVPAWMATTDTMRDHLAALAHARAVQASVRKHGRHSRAYRELAAQRLEALTPADAHGARIAPASCVASVERWAREGVPTKRAA